jgi:Putative adhesin
MAQDKAEAKVKTDEFCHNWSDGDRHNLNEVREFTVPSSGSVTVDGGMNGGVSIIGGDRSDVFIRACVQTYGKTVEDSSALAKGITIQTGSVIKADGPSDAKNGWGENKGWGVSYRIYVPRNTNLKLTTHNGGIKISGVNGTMEFDALNGGIKLNDIAGNVKGRTVNGGIHVELAGKSWSGTGLDVQTTNGGVKITMPENYAAHVETGTVNGGFKSDIAGLAPPPVDENQRKYGHRAVRINTDINGGGAPIRLITTNGGVKISTPGNED